MPLLSTTGAGSGTGERLVYTVVTGRGLAGAGEGAVGADEEEAGEGESGAASPLLLSAKGKKENQKRSNRDIRISASRADRRRESQRKET